MLAPAPLLVLVLRPLARARPTAVWLSRGSGLPTNQPTQKPPRDALAWSWSELAWSWSESL